VGILLGLARLVMIVIRFALFVRVAGIIAVFVVIILLSCCLGRVMCRDCALFVLWAGVFGWKR
jgi:hypothetical protein